MVTDLSGLRKLNLRLRVRKAKNQPNLHQRIFTKFRVRQH